MFEIYFKHVFIRFLKRWTHLFFTLQLKRTVYTFIILMLLRYLWLVSIIGGDIIIIDQKTLNLVLTLVFLNVAKKFWTWSFTLLLKSACIFKIFSSSGCLATERCWSCEENFWGFLDFRLKISIAILLHVCNWRILLWTNDWLRWLY